LIFELLKLAYIGLFHLVSQMTASESEIREWKSHHKNLFKKFINDETNMSYVKKIFPLHNDGINIIIAEKCLNDLFRQDHYPIPHV
jgi:hypothetical protein